MAAVIKKGPDQEGRASREYEMDQSTYQSPDRAMALNRQTTYDDQHYWPPPPPRFEPQIPAPLELAKLRVEVHSIHCAHTPNMSQMPHTNSTANGPTPPPGSSPLTGTLLLVNAPDNVGCSADIGVLGFLQRRERPTGQSLVSSRERLCPTDGLRRHNTHGPHGRVLNALTPVCVRTRIRVPPHVSASKQALRSLNRSSVRQRNPNCSQHLLAGVGTSG